jgi:hypothetical protein
MSTVIGLIPGIDIDHYQNAMADLMAGSLLDRNLAIFAHRA